MKLPSYTAVIRTLGTAGEKYQILLDCLISQSHKPKKIIVYLAQGCTKPLETVGIEEIKFVPKGMVAQRALKYEEVTTDWILFLDDDVYIPKDGVHRIFKELLKKNADVIAVDPFPHHKLSIKQKVTMGLLLTSIPRIFNREKGYTVNILGSDCYNPNPKNDSAWSSTNAGMAFLARKNDFLKLKFEEELWLDKTPSAIPDDKIMFYKMHLLNFKILTHYNSGFIHLDAGASLLSTENKDKLYKMYYSIGHNYYIFHHLYILPNLNLFQRIFVSFVTPYKRLINFIYNKYRHINKAISEGEKDAKQFIRQRKYLN